MWGKKLKKQEVARRHLEDKSSYRDIERRNGFSKNTAMKYVHEMGRRTKSSFWIARNLHPEWSGILCFDGTYIRVRDIFIKLARREGWISDERFAHKMSALLSVDYHTRDLPHYSLADNENMIDLVMHFNQLRQNGYDVKILVRDGNERIGEAAKKAYGRPMVTQLCHRHFLAKMDERIHSGEWIHERDKMCLLKRKILFVIRADTIDESLFRMSQFMDQIHSFRTSSNMDYLVNRFLRDFECLTMYLQYPKGLIPTTINVAENMNKQLKDRLTGLSGFKTIRSASDYLNLWCLKRRFQKFTDCKKPHHHFNGKAPLELAGCDISRLNYLDL